jgi:predicted nucleic acid-binding protein
MKRSRATGAAVVDSSCLICLLHLDQSLRLHLVQSLVIRYGAVYIPEHVLEEVGRKGKIRHRLQEMLRRYPFLKRCTVGDEWSAKLLYDRRLSPSARIQRGEAEAITQARELNVGEVLMDDRKARNIALNHGLRVRGIVGLLKEFKRADIIPMIKPLIEKLRNDGKCRITDQLLKQELEEVGE